VRADPMSAAHVLPPLPKLVEDDFPSDSLYEIIDGVKVEMPPTSADSSAVVGDLATFLTAWGVANNVGKAYPEMLMKLPNLGTKNRRPDVVFIPFSKWTRGIRPPQTNAWDILPDLCIEVVSPNDNADEVETKVEEYLAAGVPTVWVVYPRHERVYVYDSPAQIRRFRKSDTLDGGTVLPGFQLPLAELFLPPAPKS
jgi:Uma2 family endonuclease